MADMFDTESMDYEYIKQWYERSNDMMKPYTIIGEIILKSGFTYKFLDWIEGKDVNQACSAMSMYLEEKHDDMEDWELYFILDGHHDDVYPVDGEDE
tara:strand:- start:180 stop:470 length:291 start_codon:yes stop_codon:yes gene_type:complete